MSEILDASEVDALLAATEAGGVELAEQAGFPRVGGPSTGQDVQLYDFKLPERVSKDQIRALEALHEGFSRNLGASFSRYLRTIVEIRVSHIEQHTYSEFIHTLPNPTSFNLLQAE